MLTTKIKMILTYQSI